MNKTELINVVAEKCVLPKKDTEKVVNEVLNMIVENTSKGEETTFIGFGTFTTKHREARQGINPKTQETIEIAAKTLPIFKAGKQLKDATKE